MRKLTIRRENGRKSRNTCYNLWQMLQNRLDHCTCSIVTIATVSVTNATERTHDSLVRLLVVRQQESALSDHDFAQQLGIARPLWSLTRAGKREVGLTLVRGVLRVYPDLTDDVIAFLKSDGTRSPVTQSALPVPERKPFGSLH